MYGEYDKAKIVIAPSGGGGGASGCRTEASNNRINYYDGPQITINVNFSGTVHEDQMILLETFITKITKLLGGKNANLPLLPKRD